MSESAPAIHSQLTNAQLDLVARQCRFSRKLTAIHVGCGDGDWVRRLRNQGWNLRGLADRGTTSRGADDIILVGSPAATIPWGAGTLDAVLYEPATLSNARFEFPERMIALANLCSCLKTRGRMLLIQNAPAANDDDNWEAHLSLLPVTVKSRTVRQGSVARVLSSLLRRSVPDVHLLEVRIGKKLPTRLEWHRLAREAVINRNQPPVAA